MLIVVENKTKISFKCSFNPLFIFSRKFFPSKKLKIFSISIIFTQSISEYFSSIIKLLSSQVISNKFNKIPIFWEIFLLLNEEKLYNI